MTNSLRYACAALTAGLAIGAGLPAAAQSAAPMAAFVGVWKMNPEKSRMERAGPKGVQTQRSSSFTWVFKPNGDSVDLNIYHTYPAPAPSKVMAVNTDGAFHPCQMQESCLSTPGDPKEQSFAFWQINSHMAARIFKIRGQITEYNVYSVSADGATFVATSWSPATPEWKNHQVFEKQ